MEAYMFIMRIEISIIIAFAAVERGRSGVAWLFCCIFVSPVAGGLLLVLFPIRIKEVPEKNPRRWAAWHALVELRRNPA